jgi:hypothetical protein
VHLASKKLEACKELNPASTLLMGFVQDEARMLPEQVQLIGKEELLLIESSLVGCFNLKGKAFKKIWTIVGATLAARKGPG